jgi:hypothetical protein
VRAGRYGFAEPAPNSFSQFALKRRPGRSEIIGKTLHLYACTTL